MVDEGGFGDLEVASHEAVGLAGYEKGLGLRVAGVGWTLLAVVKNLMHGYQTSQHDCTHDRTRHCISCHVHQIGLGFSRE
jgi:hypothetical protein